MSKTYEKFQKERIQKEHYKKKSPFFIVYCLRIPIVKNIIKWFFKARYFFLERSVLKQYEKDKKSGKVDYEYEQEIKIVKNKRKNIDNFFNKI